MKTLTGLLLLLFGHGVSSVMHSLRFFFTASSGLSTFPEFVIVGMVDEVLFGYYDSNGQIIEPKQAWMEQLTRDDPDYVERETRNALGTQQTYKARIETLKKRFNQTGERPQVSLLQISPSSPVVCHATGFYPDRVVVFWRRDSQELHEDVDHGEVLPNHDGTFQVSVDLDLTSVPQEDWGRYECVVQLKGIEDIFTPLDPAKIRTNWRGDGGVKSDITPIIIGSVLAALLLAAAAVVVGVVLYKKRNGSDTSSENTEGLNPAAEAQPLTTKFES